MSPRLSALLSDARAAGYDVAERGTCVEICRYDTRRTERRYRAPVRGIVLYENGTAFDATVPLSVAKGFRSFAAMRKVLGLKEEAT